MRFLTQFNPGKSLAPRLQALLKLFHVFLARLRSNRSLDFALLMRLILAIRKID
jgi:hypothetical protein